MRRHTRVAVALTVGLSLLAAACGDDKKSDSTTSTAASTTAASTPDTNAPESTAPTTDGGSETTEAPEGGDDLVLDKPIMIVGLISDPGGTDVNAVPDHNNGVRLAVKEINAAGGIGGQQITYKAIESPATGDAIVNSFNLGLDDKPDLIVGPSSSATLLQIAAMVDEAQIPLIHTATEPKATHDGEAGSPWIWSNRTSNATEAGSTGKFVVEKMDKKRIGIIYVNSSFGIQGRDAIKAAVEAAGGEIVKESAVEYNATDVTNNILEMKDADAIIDWGTPTTVALGVKTLAQQGMSDIPYVGPASIAYGFFAQIVGDNSLLEGMYGGVDCNPIGSSDPAAQKFVADFAAEYPGQEANYASAEMYDTIYLFADAVKRAGSLDKDAVREAIEATKDFKGVCTTYTNINGILNHKADIVQYNADGKLDTIETVDA